MFRSAAVGAVAFVSACASTANAEPPRGHVMGEPIPAPPPPPAKRPPPPPPTAAPPAPAPGPAAADVQTSVIPADVASDETKRVRPAPAEDVTSGGEPEPYRRKWYGWQTLATDGAAAALLLMTVASYNGGGGDANTPLLMLSGGTYLLGAPIVHGVNGRGGIGAASLGLRIGLPMLGAIMGGGSEGSGGAGLGIMVGVSTAVVLDAAVFARKRVPAGEPAQPAQPAPAQPRTPPSDAGGTTAKLTPSIVPTRGGALAGVIGLF